MIDKNKSISFTAISKIAAVLLFFAAATVNAQQPPTPKSVLGFHPTDDRTIAGWSQITDYFAKLDAASPKVAVREIGKSTLGRPQIAAFISSAANIRNLETIRQISAKLANPASIKDAAELQSLIKQGKTIVSISCSIHSTEIVASQMSMNLAYELASATDPATAEILENTVLILIPSSNPDGIDIVADWYRKTLGTKFEGTAPPELYHHYAGHDNNRDWFMLNLRESRNITKLYWQEWFPQFVYDVHQQGPNGSRFTIPPFFDPPNPRIAPVILRDLGTVGYKMAADLQAAGMSGVATNATYDTWWHGGFRSAPYYHNSIGILSEAASANLMTPIKITREQLQRNSTRGLRSAMETATNFPDPWQGGEWRPADIARMEMIASRSLLEMAAKFRERYLKSFHDLGKANLTRRDEEPEAFVIPAGQPQAESVSRMLEVLMWQGIEIHEMTQEGWFVHDPKKRDEYHEMPLGSFLIYVNQAQKNNILSLFEKQVYPNRLNPNGEAEVPYDVAGWTLPLQMGVEAVPVWRSRDLGGLKPLAGINQARSVMNLKSAPEPFAKIANPLKTSPRVGLYKGFTSSMDEGWTRLVLDNHSIPYRSVSDTDMRSGNIDVDALILPADSETTIVKGLSAERYPAEFAGGIGEAGVENLKKFVSDGRTLVCFDDGCELVIKHFALPMKNVLSGLKRSEFYNPGSIVNVDIDRRFGISRGLGSSVAAYFINSSAWEIADPEKVKSIARYSSKDSLLSGWMLGEKFINGRTALAESEFGKGRIVLFGFRPQHRGQTWATFPLIFNSLERK